MSGSGRQLRGAAGPLRPAVPWIVVLVVLGAVLYIPALHAPFVFDDEDTVLTNPNIRDLRSFAFLTDPVPGSHPLNNRPVSSFTFAVGYALFGLDPAGHRLMNVLIHILTALALFDVIRRSLLTPRLNGSLGPGAVSIAGLAACLWIAHPLMSEPVMYITQRTEQLMALFYLLSVDAMLVSAEPGTAGPRTLVFKSVAVACAFLATASKEVALSLPIFLLLLDRALLSGSFREALKRRPLVHAGAFSTWIMLLWMVTHGAREQTVGFHLGMTSWQYMKLEAQVLMHYLRLVFWPVGLSVSYEWPVPGRFLEWAVPGAIVLLLVSIAGIGLARNRPLALLGALPLLMLAPTSSFVPFVKEPATERRMYLPATAILLFVVLVIRQVAGGRGGAHRRRLLPAMPCLAAVLLLAAGTWSRTRTWDTAESLWTDAIERNPANVQAQNNLAQVYLSQGEPDRAIGPLETALASRPHHMRAWHNLGLAYLALGRLDEAENAMNRALRIEERPATHAALARVHWRQGRTEESRRDLEAALRLDDGYGPAHLGLGRLLALDGNIARARHHLEIAARSLPDPAPARDALDQLDRASVSSSSPAAASEAARPNPGGERR